MVARFTDAGAELMMKQIVQNDNPFRMDGDQAYMHYDAMSITIDKERGTLVNFHWKNKVIYTLTQSNYFGKYGDTLHLTGVQGRMGVHHHTN